ncbi:MAG: DUF2167 domain-containing protein [Granulosicoccus sp.]|nr:DUF2167 domain-containing protein [Granulosicoccus sp.]
MIQLKWVTLTIAISFGTLATAQGTGETATAESTADTTAVPTDSEQEYIDWATGIWDSLDRQTGSISLPIAGATLTVPESFYYLNPTDAQKVLVEVWGNPPGQETLGMLFPADLTPFDEESWAVTVQYEEDGYVSDEDADKINYADLLKDMQQDTLAASEERVNAGYEAISLVGWAADPYYNPTEHKLYWAKELKFGEDDLHTLNYNIRVLGRKGVLLLNFIAGMEQKTTIESNLDTVLSMAEFDTGSTYGDFDPDIDKVAAYGLGALVAGKVIAKTGLIAVAVVFLKKFGVFIILGVAALLKTLYSRRKKKLGL